LKLFNITYHQPFNVVGMKFEHARRQNLIVVSN